MDHDRGTNATEPEHVARARHAEVAILKDVILEHFQSRAFFLRSALDQAEARNHELAQEVEQLRAHVVLPDQAPASEADDMTVDPRAADQPEGPWGGPDAPEAGP